jgi:valyl-tRNA synthetase
MQAALSVLLRLFAPYLPYVTEEAWSWWHEGSIHKAPWPAAADLAGLAAPDSEASAVLAVTTEVLGEIRRAKSEGKRPLKVGISRAVVRDTAERLRRLEQARADLCGAANIQQLMLELAESFGLELEFQELEPPVPEAGAR